MDEKDAIDVVGNDNEMGRDIIKTHLYYLQNISLLSNRERGYFCDQYFPYLKEYYQAPLEPDVSNFDNTYQVGADGE